MGNEPLVEVADDDMFALQRYVHEVLGETDASVIQYTAARMIVAVCEGQFVELRDHARVSGEVAQAVELLRSSYEMTNRELANVAYTALVNWVRGELE